MRTVINSKGFRLVSFDSGKPGLTVCISGGVHGNETCGVKAIEKLETELLSKEKLSSGRVLTLIANQEAIKVKKRFVDFDLNRAFGNPNAIGHESNLANDIASHLQGIDYLLDLHSTSAATEPFCAAILTKDHLETFEIIDINVYTHGWEIHRGYSMLIDEVNRIGGIGIIAECGKNDNEETNNVAYRTTISLLRKLRLLSQSNSKLTVKKDKIIRIKSIYKTQSDNFLFTRNYKNLDNINADEVVAYDDKRPISYNFPFIIVMPTVTNLVAGGEAFGIGIKEEKT